MGSYQTALEEKKIKKNSTLKTLHQYKRKLCRSEREVFDLFYSHFNQNQQTSSHSEDDMSSNVDHEQLLPVVCELLHQLLPVAAGTQVGLVEAPDVLDDFLSLHALPEGHSLSDIGCNLGYIL